MAIGAEWHNFRITQIEDSQTCIMAGIGSKPTRPTSRLSSSHSEVRGFLLQDGHEHDVAGPCCSSVLAALPNRHRSNRRVSVKVETTMSSTEATGLVRAERLARTRQLFLASALAFSVRSRPQIRFPYGRQDIARAARECFPCRLGSRGERLNGSREGCGYLLGRGQVR